MTSGLLTTGELTPEEIVLKPYINSPLFRAGLYPSVASLLTEERLPALQAATLGMSSSSSGKHLFHFQFH